MTQKSVAKTEGPESGSEPDLLVISAPEHDASAYHLTGFLAPDAVIAARVEGRTYLAVSSLEYGRAKRQAAVDELLSYDELGIRELARELGGGGSVLAAAAADLLKKLGARSVTVPPNLGVVHADELRRRGVEVEPGGAYFAGLRRAKTEREVGYIEEVQRATEAAVALAREVLSGSEVLKDGTLVHEGAPLTSEGLRSVIDVDLLRRGFHASGTIVAGGPQAADPHERGSGPLRAGETIIVDVFPSSAKSRYFADMTRTFVKGEPSDEVRKMYRTVLAAQERALESIRPGVSGREVHRAVSEVIHAAGYKTLLHDQRPGEPLTEGFFHGTGHGVGLELHEGPSLGTQDTELLPGDVVTVEPGVYTPGLGGVRIEDLVVVTESGLRNLTDFPKSFDSAIV
ncbi:Xaa-Pro aminopeptidase [Rubrobacter radiotolerans]|uniref:Xaa-Pro aminopeptidase n=1 Tax=Rubrobacter radiotolerans TaxID=42256 RepID=A0A023X6A7_RUBRA|nr:Xaa-Pro peptidase family protein [Rubrobacter radiotolerans]AHY47559.1 Xaa-Pro aminopeptidase [Rubrobacter radiotolerans]MDX5894964.1 Xaa-Pro peptidase family protein [Rubrobacter radiotolerans]SMC07154.1 Xaa-Pro aminopeptidase [Rubrobacter radiotolerans DSM 5868]